MRRETRSDNTCKSKGVTSRSVDAMRGCRGVDEQCEGDVVECRGGSLALVELGLGLKDQSRQVGIARRIDSSRPRLDAQVAIKGHERHPDRGLFPARLDRRRLPARHRQRVRSIDKVLRLPRSSSQDDIVHSSRTVPGKVDCFVAYRQIAEVVALARLHFEVQAVRLDVRLEVGEGGAGVGSDFGGCFGETVEFGDDCERDDDGPAAGLKQAGEEPKGVEEDIGIEDEDRIACDGLQSRSSSGLRLEGRRSLLASRYAS